MRALVLADGLRLVADLPRPRPGPGEVVLRVRLAGICRTDLEILQGYLDYQGVPGHEFVGELLADGPWPAGTRVVGEINCLSPGEDPGDWHLRAHHPRRTVLGIQGRDGVFAEECCLPVANLHRVPPGLSDELAVFTEPLAAACRVAEQLRPAPGTPVAVLGCGRLGFLVAQVLVAAGCRVLAVDRHPEKLEPLRERGVDVASPDALPPPRGLPVVVDCTGRPEGFGAALALLRPGGTLVLKSTCSGARPLNLAPVVVHEIRVLGSRCGPFAEALDLLAAGRVDPRPLVEAVLPLSRGPEALARAARLGARKILLDPRA